MQREGRLVVFEGPDGVGKSTLIGQTEAYLKSHSIKFLSVAFPGKDPHTLGWVVNRIHHEPQRYEISSLTPLSLQALHIAAHLDNIEARILPALLAGTFVILDRFWWSTWVYGRAANVNVRILDQLIEAEKMAWSGKAPSMALLITRTVSMRPEHSQENFVRLAALYSDLALAESKRYPVATVSTEDTDRSFEPVLSALSTLIEE
jgi:thymidylate kinase